MVVKIMSYLQAIFPNGKSNILIMIRIYLCRAICLVFCLVFCYSAAAATRSPAIVSNLLNAGTPVELIVEYDDTEIEKNATIMRSSLPRRLDDARIRAYKADNYIILKNQVDSALVRPDIQHLRSYSHLPMSFKRFNSLAALDAFLAQPGVKAVHFNEKMHRVLAQSLPLINQPTVASAGEQGSGTTVAVIDDGINFTHAAFGSCTAPGSPSSCRVVVSQNMVAVPGTNFDHGSNVAAIVLGVAPASKIAMLNVFDASGSASASDIISAIDWSIANQASYNIVAVNMSLGGSAKYTAACGGDWSATPITHAKTSGISVVVAAGNSTFTNGLSSPACAPGAISVGAVYDSNIGGITWATSPNCTDSTTTSDKVTCFSNSANFLTMLAPGAMITAAGITEAGTSQASPHVAGAVAVLRSTFPNETLTQTQTRLTSTGVAVTDPRNGIVKPRLSLVEAARPANDAFANRTAFSGQSGSTSAITLLSTKEAGEPSHAGNAGGHSVWWKWIAPASGQFSLDTHGSNIDTLLAAYTGGSASTLVNIAANDNDGYSNGTSSLLLQAQSGMEYEIAIDGQNGAAGLAQLNWSLNTVANANLTVEITGPASVLPGATSNYVISVSNAGPQTATNVYVNATLPVSASYVSGSPECSINGSLVTCLLGSMASGSTATPGFQVVWNSITAPVNIAVSAASDVPDSTSTNNSGALQIALDTGSNNGDTPTLPEWGMVLLMLLLLGINVRTRQRNS